eukprot:NODE_14889_length_1079_cov_5.679622.p1 GENE.NODE_14889_length_1079_cov_5.679622~~NODE_14889_length_1079_cov_5.679622.p1  ORF type:complete len:255 (-),score=52.89 NODE_14889_length_1079_cov_5.679622:211-975(-)
MKEPRTRRVRGDRGDKPVYLAAGAMVLRARRSQPILLVAIGTLLSCAVEVDSSAGTTKDSPAMKMLGCDSCRIIAAELSKDVKYLVESDKMWRPKDLNERVEISCLDPSIASGAMRNACSYMLSDYRTVIAREVALRWSEDSDEFEEDIVPAELCEKMGACREGHKMISEMIAASDTKEKALKDARAEKASKEEKAERKSAEKAQKAAAAAAKVAEKAAEKAALTAAEGRREGNGGEGCGKKGCCKEGCRDGDG